MPFDLNGLSISPHSTARTTPRNTHTVPFCKTRPLLHCTQPLSATLLNLGKMGSFNPAATDSSLAQKLQVLFGCAQQHRRMLMGLTQSANGA